MVLDEPTSNLDIKAIGELKQTLLAWKQSGKTIVIAEHRLSWLQDLCDRVICMKNGEVAFDIPMSKFEAFSTEQLHSYGLRSLVSGQKIYKKAGICLLLLFVIYFFRPGDACLKRRLSVTLRRILPPGLCAVCALLRADENKSFRPARKFYSLFFFTALSILRRSMG